MERVNGIVQEAEAIARANAPSVDFRTAATGRLIRQKLEAAQEFKPKGAVGTIKRTIATWAAGAERFGASGAVNVAPSVALEQPQQRRPFVAANDALVDQFNLVNEMKGGAQSGKKQAPDAVTMDEFLAAGARLQEFGDGRSAATLDVVVLLDGSEHSDAGTSTTRVIVASGNGDFDAWVSSALSSLSLNESSVTRGKWRVTATPVARRRLTGSIHGSNLLGVASMLALGALSGQRAPLVGRFDESTGLVDVVDPSATHFEYSVVLVAETQ